MTQEQINKYSVVMAEFMGYKREFETKGRFDTGRGYYSHTLDFLCFNSSYDSLMPVWVKFRDMYEPELGKALWDVKENIKTIIVMKPIEEAFEELGKAIEWYNTIKK